MVLRQEYVQHIEGAAYKVTTDAQKNAYAIMTGMAFIAQAIEKHAESLDLLADATQRVAEQIEMQRQA